MEGAREGGRERRLGRSRAIGRRRASLGCCSCCCCFLGSSVDGVGSCPAPLPPAHPRCSDSSRMSIHLFLPPVLPPSLLLVFSVPPQHVHGRRLSSFLPWKEKGKESDGEGKESGQ